MEIPKRLCKHKTVSISFQNLNKKCNRIEKSFKNFILIDLTSYYTYHLIDLIHSHNALFDNSF